MKLGVSEVNRVNLGGREKYPYYSVLINGVSVIDKSIHIRLMAEALIKIGEVMKKENTDISKVTISRISNKRIHLLALIKDSE